MSTVAALYVQTGGRYFNQSGIDPWDITRDARKYAGPHPVVAHPPCQLWGPPPHRRTLASAAAKHPPSLPGRLCSPPYRLKLSAAKFT